MHTRNCQKLLCSFTKVRRTHQAAAYPSFCCMKRLGVFLLPQDGLLVHRRVTSAPALSFADAHLCTWAERHCESNVSCRRTRHSVLGQGSNSDRSIGRRAYVLTMHEVTTPPGKHLEQYTSFDILKFCPTLVLLLPTLQRVQYFWTINETVLGWLHFDRASLGKRRVLRVCIKTLSLQAGTVSTDLDSREFNCRFRSTKKIAWKKTVPASFPGSLFFLLPDPHTHPFDQFANSRLRHPALAKNWVVTTKACDFQKLQHFTTTQITTNILLSSLDFFSFIESVNVYSLQIALASRKWVVIVRAR